MSSNIFKFSLSLLFFVIYEASMLYSWIPVNLSTDVYRGFSGHGVWKIVCAPISSTPGMTRRTQYFAPFTVPLFKAARLFLGKEYQGMRRESNE
jgi:hypothetical protein